MTINTHDRDELTATITRIGDDLRQAEHDVALLLRLKTAEDDAKRLAVELRTAEDALTKLIADEEAAQRKAAYSQFADISITETGEEANVLARHFTIHISKFVWDGFETVPQTVSVVGFAGLPADAFNYLLDCHPGRIPTKIMALCPDDAWEAFNRYLAGKQRGYLNTAAA